MIKRIHLFCGMLAAACMVAFFVGTIAVELLGSAPTVAGLKSLIVTPGLWVLIPALAATGGSGAVLSRGRGGRLVDRKRTRMPFIAANGLLVLMPCALALNHLAAAGDIGPAFYAVQAIELMAGAVNLGLIALNIRDGRRLAGSKQVSPPMQARAS